MRPAGHTVLAISAYLLFLGFRVRANKMAKDPILLLGVAFNGVVAKHGCY